MMARITGKTFRKTLYALQNASAGQIVVYVCPNENKAKWHFNQAVMICNSFMLGSIRVQVHQKTIHFPVGRLEFIPVDKSGDKLGIGCKVWVDDCEGNE